MVKRSFRSGHSDEKSAEEELAELARAQPKEFRKRALEFDAPIREVKSSNGGLRMNQLKWIGAHPNLPTEVIVVE